MVTVERDGGNHFCLSESDRRLNNETTATLINFSMVDIQRSRASSVQTRRQFIYRSAFRIPLSIRRVAAKNFSTPTLGFQYSQNQSKSIVFNKHANPRTTQKSSGLERLKNVTLSPCPVKLISPRGRSAAKGIFQ